MSNEQIDKLDNNLLNGSVDDLERGAIVGKLSSDNSLRDKDLENEYLTSEAMRKANTRMEQS